jgi:predicted XRE-type DNA-binding protein
MSKKRFANVWDAIEDTPAQAENMKLRSPGRASEIESDRCGRGAL